MITYCGVYLGIEVIWIHSNLSLYLQTDGEFYQTHIVPNKVRHSHPLTPDHNSHSDIEPYLLNHRFLSSYQNNPDSILLDVLVEILHMLFEPLHFQELLACELVSLFHSI